MAFAMWYGFRMAFHFTDESKARLFDALLDGTITAAGGWDADGAYRGPFSVHAPFEIFGSKLRPGDTLRIEGLVLS